MIYLAVRATTDWTNEAAVRAQLPAGFHPAVELWNETFTMPYHVFRHELTRIAQRNWSCIPGAACARVEELPDNAVVVPTDDDDWFSPQLARAIETILDPAHVGYYWPSEFIEVPISLRHQLGRIRRTIFPRTPPRWLCTTNNYAVVMGADTAPLIHSHLQASQWFVAHPAAVIRIDQRLSVMNRTLASRTSLSAKPSRAALVHKLHRYQRVYRRTLPPELSWCQPYVAMMDDLVEQLRRRQ